MLERLDLSDWSTHGFRLTTPGRGGNEESVLPLLGKLLNSNEPLQPDLKRDFERYFGRSANTEQDIAREYLAMLAVLGEHAGRILDAPEDTVRKLAERERRENP